MKTLVTLQWVEEADRLCSYLEGNGIQTFMPDRNTLSLQPFYGVAAGGVRIQVDEEQLEEAKELASEFLRDMAAPPETCPFCGSENIDYVRFSLKAVLASVFLLGIPLLRRRGKICRDCGQDPQEYEPE